MHFKRAAVVYKMPVEMAKLVLTRYLQAVPEIPRWWQEVQDTINRTRTIINPLGRKRIFFGRLDDEIYRQAYSHSAQSIVADVIDRAFALADEVFDESECFPLLQVHDEIVFACREGLEQKYVPLVKRVMEYPIQIEGVGAPLVIPSETTVGPNWYDQKELV
jgi:DNA polymerase I-like protein with 3'-5' exonuclease and polymerase domains